jgi:hypothetical protein
MKTKNISILLAILLITIGSAFIQKQTEPWTKDQLMEPKDLAAVINDNSIKVRPVIIDIGPAGLIKGAVEIGPAHEQESFDKLKVFLSKQTKDAQIVIYCGCCPFEHCPNVRPAFKLLNDLGFTHQKLLNLSHNLKTDWINNGYPMDSSK